MLQEIMNEKYLFSSTIFEDDRGFFEEVWNLKHPNLADFDGAKQINRSISKKANTLRGLHFQLEPFGQSKLVWITKGAVLDVIVDLRKSSPNFGRHAKAVLSEQNRKKLYIPVGFAHGFKTLEDNTEFYYVVSAEYSPSHDSGIFWNDPNLNIDWEIDGGSVIISTKDENLMPFDKNYKYFE